MIVSAQIYKISPNFAKDLVWTCLLKKSLLEQKDNKKGYINFLFCEINWVKH